MEKYTSEPEGTGCQVRDLVRTDSKVPKIELSTNHFFAI